MSSARTFADHFAAFLIEELERGRRPRTLLYLQKTGRAFVRFLEERDIGPGGVTLEVAEAYQGYLLETRLPDGQRATGRPYNLRTVAYNVNGAGAFCDYLVRVGVALDNPFHALTRVRLPATIPEGILNERDMAALLAALAQWNMGAEVKCVAQRYVTHVVAELQYASGLRIAEVAALTSDDVDVERAIVYVRDGKHGSNRVGFLTEYAADVLDEYMRVVRPDLTRCAWNVARKPERLFFRDYDTLSHAVNSELARACAQAGVPRITSHGFRHALGYHLLRAGCPIRYIQAILGHKHLADTEVYTKVDVEDVKKVFDECHPRMTSAHERGR